MSAHESSEAFMNALLVVLLLLFTALALLVFRISGFKRPLRWQRDPIKAGVSEGPRRFLITGGTGFIGYRIGRQGIESGDELWILTRSIERASELYGPHATLVRSLDEVANDVRFDVMINLAGAPIFDRPWTKQRREELVQSRLTVTQGLIDLIKRLDHKPRS